MSTNNHVSQHINSQQPHRELRVVDGHGVVLAAHAHEAHPVAADGHEDARVDDEAHDAVLAQDSTHMP